MLGLGLDPVTLARNTGLGTAALPPLLVSPPSVAGSGAVGTLLTGSIGTWVTRPGQSFTWAWQRDGAVVPGLVGTGSVVAPFAVAPADHGAAIRLRVTASTAAGEATVFSDPVLAAYPSPVAGISGWTVPLRLGEPMDPLSVAPAFSGLDLVYSVDPGAAPLPAGLSLDAGGTISGTPGGAATTANIRILATNPGGSAALPIALAVRAAAFTADYVAAAYTAGGVPTTFAGLHGFSRSGTATRLDPAGALEDIPADQPRFDHDAAGLPLGLLVETAATNRLTGSEDLATGWSTASVGSAPAGLSRRGRWGGIVLTSTGSTFGRFNQAFPVTTDEALPLTLYCLPGTSGRLRIQFRDPVGGAASRVRGSFGGLSVVAADIGPVAELAEVTAADGIVEVSLVFRPTFSGDVEIGIGPDSAVSGETLTLLAVQTARGSFIPTAAAPAARGADLVGLSGIGPTRLDLALTYDDDSRETLAGLPITSGDWPAQRRPRLKRMAGHPAAHDALTLADGSSLVLESGAALSLETPA